MTRTLFYINTLTLCAIGTLFVFITHDEITMRTHVALTIGLITGYNVWTPGVRPFPPSWFNKFKRNH